MGFHKGQIVNVDKASSREEIETAIIDYLLFMLSYCSKTSITDHLISIKMYNTDGKAFNTKNLTPYLTDLVEQKRINKFFDRGSERFGFSHDETESDAPATELFLSGKLKVLGDHAYYNEKYFAYFFPTAWNSPERQFGIYRFCWASGKLALDEFAKYRKESYGRIEPITSEQQARIFPANRLNEFIKIIDPNLKNQFIEMISGSRYASNQIHFAVIFFLEHTTPNERTSLTFHESYLFHFIGTGDNAGACVFFGEHSFSTMLFEAFTALLEYRGADAARLFSSSIAVQRKITKKRTFVPDGTVGICWLLMLLAEDREREFNEENPRFSKLSKNFLVNGFLSSVASARELNGKKYSIDTFIQHHISSQKGCFFSGVVAVLALFVGRTLATVQIANQLLTMAASAEKLGFGSLAKFLGNGAQQKEVPLNGLLFKSVENWELLLKRLEELADGTSSDSKESAASDKRLVWLIDWSTDFQNFSVEPIEQTLQKKGWSKGKAVAFKRLKTNTGDLSFLLPQDLSLIKAITKESVGWYNETYYSLSMDKAFPAMIDHPHLFRKSSGQQIQLLRKEPQLQVIQSGKKVKLKLDPSPKNLQGHYVMSKSDDESTLYYTNFTPEIRDLHKLLSAEDSIPAEALPQVEKLVGKLSRVITVAGNVASSEIKTESGDGKIKIRCTPQDGALSVQLIVIPSPESGAVVPGSGSEILQVRRGAIPLQIKRNLKSEKKSAESVVESCGTLTPTNNYSWYLSDPMEQLRFLSELKSLTPIPEILWPEGKSIEVSAPVSANSLKLGITGSIDWLELDGLITIDDGEEIKLAELLAKIRESQGSRFIALSERKFMAITEKLRKQLDLLAGVSRSGKKKIEIHPLALLASSDLVEESIFTDKSKIWNEIRERWNRGQEHIPTVPNTLEATLRPYQEEGFFWASRLAMGGFGACLADDMGLGKTVQSIALLLERSKGSALVIAPTSLINVWHREIMRFAPSLKTVTIGSADSVEPICAAGTVTITSYGVMLSREDQFVDHHWHTLIIDEAQAIKNSGAKRTKVVKSLKADFRMACTGTPVENHTGELWSLFDFIVPGLLGTSDQFSQKYNSNESIHRLKALVKPFILRRRKSEVLTELPAKTEIILPVTLSEDERNRYDALRIAALKEIENSSGEKMRFSILAHLTKLRQSCCHPALLDPSYEGRSAKLELLAEEIAVLRENGHRALIFSQFVSHLQIVKSWCDSSNISYHYLDGSTSQKDRAKSVESFQSGDGELFLISLKAGGTGLTLTGADYVFILDPWWNPAVEDQAADRTHRIGQTRPVTVYRLVAEDSVEEKIMELHAGKRELTDALLSETGVASALTEDQLLDLFRG